jgi:Ca-activated chloride channel family protein
MRLAVFAVSLTGLAGGTFLADHLFAADEAGRGKKAVVRFDESSRGDLAVGVAVRGPWSVVRRGDELPAESYLRTSATGPCRVQIGDGTLQLAPETRARVVATERRIEIIAGRIFIQGLAEWTVRAETIDGKLSAGTAAEFEVSSGQVEGKVLAGALQLSGEKLEPATVAAGQMFVREPNAAAVIISNTAPAEIERLRALAEAPRRAQGLGQLVVNDPQSNSPVRLNLARYHVNVVLHPPVALVQIDQSFYNPYAMQQEGTFVFNLPEGASVSRFAMYTTPTQLVEGELIERERASSIYQSIVNRRRDPAILEQIGGNLFRMRVFPIFGLDTKRILLDYTVPIVERDDGRYTFELPLMSDLEPVWDFSITGAIRGPNVAGMAHSPSHPAVAFEQNAQGMIRFAFKQKSYSPEETFVLGFQQRPAADATIRSFVAPAKAAVPAHPFFPADKTAVESPCEFLATVSPAVLEPTRREQRADSSPVDVVILADTSGGMGHRARQRQAVRTIAGALRPEDRFRLGCVDVDYRGLTNGWVAPGTAGAEEELALLDREFFLGGTEFLTSFANAAKSLPPAENGRRRMLVYVGDGALPDVQAAAATAFRELVDKEIAGVGETMARSGLRFSAVLVENEPSGRFLMERLAGATGGRVFRLGSGTASSDLFDWALAGCPNAARIVSIKAEGADGDDVFASTAWIPGRALHIFGRRKEAGPMKLALAFERDGKVESREWNLTLKNDLDDLFVGRLWAQRKLDQLRAVQSQPAIDRQIVSLSQEWTLLSRLTAFLVLESEEEYPRYGITRQTRHQYWKPEDAVVEKPLPPEAIAALKAVPKASRARESRAISSNRFYEALASARLALEKRAPNRALVFLGSVLESPLVAESGEYAELKEAALQMLARGDVVRSLGPERGWFDRRRPVGFASATTDLVWQLLHGFGSAGRHEDRWQEALAKQAAPPADRISPQDFIKWFQTISGIPVIVDTSTLTDEGIALDHPVSLRGIRVMSLDSMLRHILHPMQLTTVADDDALTITTFSKASDTLDTRLYPVADLLLTTPRNDFSLLVNPSLDRQLLATRRLNEKIDRRLSLDVDAASFEDVVEFLNARLEGNIILDRPTLADEGVALDRPVTLKMDNVPARRILKRLCEPLQLEAVLKDEAVVITTSAKAGELLETRVHSAVGVVFELPPEIMRQRAANPWNARGPAGGGVGAMGMGGMGMGMGGMGMGRMGGGLGGMMGGMGFGGGFVGGNTTGTENATSSSGTAISQSSTDGDDEKLADATTEGAAPKRTDAEPAGDDLDGSNRPGTAPPFDSSSGRGPSFVIDGLPSDRQSGWTDASHSASGTMNMITSTIRPDSWEDLSGPGSTMYFRHSLAFVLRQTQSIHSEIEELLERVRELPTVYGDQSGWRPAQVPEIGPNDVARWDVNSLMNVLETTVQPDSWDNLSGRGTILPIRPKLALSIRQTQAVHDEIRNLLTCLRRARYLARQGRVWKSDGLMDGPWLATALALTDIPPGPRQSELPEPESEELKALAILAEPIAGVQAWRSVSAGGRGSTTTVIRQTAARSEFEFEGRLARVSGDEAAVAYPGVGLVERGAWGEGVRRIVDGRLPWFPHRSRRELAQMFVVRVAAENAQSVQLRFGLPAAAPGNEILLTVSRKNGLPTAWESRLGNETVLRLRFEDLGAARGRPFWRTVVAEDAKGRDVERWTLADFAALPAEIPAVDSGWKNYVVVDLRDQARGVLPPVIAVLQAIRQRDWNAADRALAAALEVQPGHPLLLVIQAWSLAQRDGGDDPRIVALLKEAARSGSAELMAPIADRSFAALPDRVLYEILLEQPVARRTLADWDNLTHVALRARRPDEALQHLKTAIEGASPSADNAERERLLVELLLDTRHPEEALARAEARAARPGVEPEELAALAETLNQRGVPVVATRLVQQALGRPEVTDERRQRLLHRRADMESGLVRWRTLLEAMEALPAGSPIRSASAAIILNELNDQRQVELAGILAAEARDSWLKAALMLRQAELYAARANTDAAAEIGWSLFEAQQLPAERTEWLCRQLAASRRHDRLVQVVEARLRSGAAVEKTLLNSLATAYDVLGQPAAARRVRTNDSDLQSETSSKSPLRNPPRAMPRF